MWKTQQRAETNLQAQPPGILQLRRIWRCARLPLRALGPALLPLRGLAGARGGRQVRQRRRQQVAEVGHKYGAQPLRQRGDRDEEADGAALPPAAASTADAQSSRRRKSGLNRFSVSFMVSATSNPTAAASTASMPAGHRF